VNVNKLADVDDESQKVIEDFRSIIEEEWKQFQEISHGYCLGGQLSENVLNMMDEVTTPEGKVMYKFIFSTKTQECSQIKPELYLWRTYSYTVMHLIFAAAILFSNHRFVQYTY